MPTDRQSIRTIQEIGVAEINGGVRILTGSSEVAVSAHAQYKFGQTLINAQRLSQHSLQFAGGLHYEPLKLRMTRATQTGVFEFYHS